MTADDSSPLDPPIFERILGHQYLSNERLQYYIKVAGRPFCESLWISDSDLSQHPQHSSLIAHYNQSPHIQINAAPYYDRRFDEKDCVIAERDGRYLVKWRRLFHDNATWESAVDESLIQAFRRRQSLRYPAYSGRRDYDAREGTRLGSYTLFGEELSRRRLFTLNFLISSWNRKESPDES